MTLLESRTTLDTDFVPASATSTAAGILGPTPLEFALDAVDRSPGRIPRHVACVMDGNGRWAQRRGFPRTVGHAAGEEALLDAVDGALELGVEWLTVYAFSTENWNRPVEEVEFLMEFNREILQRHRDYLNSRGVRVRFVGRRDAKVPPSLLDHMDSSIALTEGNRRLTLTIAFNYGGQAELIDAIKAMVADGVSADEIDPQLVQTYLYDPEMPDVDLMVRTSGEMRISNFLLWQVAYSELVFTDVLWPDFRKEHLYASVAEHQRRDRRFGGVIDLRDGEGEGEAGNDGGHAGEGTLA